MIEDLHKLKITRDQSPKNKPDSLRRLQSTYASHGQ